MEIKLEKKNDVHRPSKKDILYLGHKKGESFFCTVCGEKVFPEIFSKEKFQEMLLLEEKKKKKEKLFLFFLHFVIEPIITIIALIISLFIAITLYDWVSG